MQPESHFLQSENLEFPVTEQHVRDVARKGYALALRRLSDRKATNVAEAMGLSDSAVSKLKTEQLEQCMSLLAHLGLKVVDIQSRCLTKTAYDHLTSAYGRVLQTQPELIWEDSGMGSLG